MRAPAWFLLMASCATAPKPVPTPASEPTAISATRCGDVVALWRGPTPDGTMPLTYSVESLAFAFPDGVEKAAKPTGTIEPPHRSLELFSTDCSWVALPQDSAGPYHLVPVAQLAAYLDGTHAPAVVEGPKGSILTDGRWTGPGRFEFFASCCGGVEVFAVDAATPSTTERVFFAPEAPNGIRRDGGGYRVIPSATSPGAP